MNAQKRPPAGESTGEIRCTGVNVANAASRRKVAAVEDTIVARAAEVDQRTRASRYKLLGLICSDPALGVHLAQHRGINPSWFGDQCHDRDLWAIAVAVFGFGTIRDLYQVARLARRALHHVGCWHEHAEGGYLSEGWDNERLATLFESFPMESARSWLRIYAHELDDLRQRADVARDALAALSAALSLPGRAA